MQCGIHKVQNALTSVMSPLDSTTISPMIHPAQSLQSANSMKLFRQCLRELLPERLDYQQCKPRGADLCHIIKQMDLHLPASSNTNRLKRAILRSLLNGDWCAQGVVQHRCQGCCTGKEDAIQKLVSFVTSVFASTAPKCWPRSRWTGARESTNWLAILEACHGLLTDVYLRWAARERGGQWIEAMRQRARVDRLSCLEAADDDNAMGDGDEGQHAEDPGAGCDQGTGELPQEAGRRGMRHKWGARQQEQSHHRRKAPLWLLSQPVLPELVLVRQVLGPLAMIMDSYLSPSGGAWDRKQLSLAAAAKRQGISDDDVGNRQLRAKLLLDGELIAKGKAELTAIVRQSDRWDVLPCQHRTVGLQTKAALMMSQVGAKIAALMGQHANYPIKLFEHMDENSDQVKAALTANPLCRYDAASLDKVLGYRSRAGPWVADFCADLWHTALLHEFDNDSREANHASIRRQIVLASTQTHTEAFQDCNAAWLLRVARRIVYQARPRPKAATRPCIGKGSGALAMKKRGSGGAWRAFVRQETLHCRAGKPDLSELGARYRSLPAERLAELKQIGQAATKAAQTGSRAFGLNARQQERAAKKRSFSEALGAASSVVMPSVALAPNAPQAFQRRLVDSSSPVLLHNPWQGLQELKHSLRQGRLLELARCKILDAELDMYGKVDGIADMDSTSATVAARPFESRAAGFASRPGHQTSRRGVFWRPASVLARVARALRLRRNSLAGKSFFSACSAVWDALCTTFQYQEVPAVTAMRQSGAQRRPCHEAGMCICNARGAMLQRFCRRVDEVAKIFCGRGKPLRPLLGQARVAYLFVAQARELHDQDPEGEVEAVTFFHVSDHSYTPWESM